MFDLYDLRRARFLGESRYMTLCRDFQPSAAEGQGGERVPELETEGAPVRLHLCSMHSWLHRWVHGWYWRVPP